MKTRLRFTVLTTIPALICATAALSQDALRKPPQPSPPAHDEEIAVEIREIRESGGRAQRQLQQSAGESGHVTFSEDGQIIAANTRLHTLLGQAGLNRAPGQALLIRTRELDPEAQSQLEEDLNVMSRIVEKAAQSEPARGPRAMGIDLVLGPGGSPVRSLYLDGYGAVFMAQVNFPLLPPPATEDSSDEKSSPATASTWEQARQEVYGVPQPPEPVFGVGWTPEHDQGRAYDAEKVEDLRQALLEAVKNATNIRQLPADESVTICVVGSTAASNSDVRVIRRRSTGDRSGAEYRTRGPDGEETIQKIEIRQELKGSQADNTRGVMTLQAKKADIDRFARGEITPAQFRELARTQTYPGGRNWSTPNTLIWNER